MDSSESVEKQLRDLVTRLKRGEITQGELASMASELSLEPKFFDHIGLLPEETIQELRGMGEYASGHPEDVFFILSPVCYSREPTYDEYLEMDKANREARYRVEKRLREYFFPGEPLPAFEPVILAGHVEETIEIDGSIVVFGEETEESNYFLIRKHPVHLVNPAGNKIITSVTKQEWIRRESDAQSPDAIVRHFGRAGLFLGENVKSAAEIPPKTALWVDRTAVAALPD
jgi:hypothetical protein